MVPGRDLAVSGWGCKWWGSDSWGAVLVGLPEGMMQS